MKYEWRKKEKEYYMPKEKPELVEIPEFKLSFQIIITSILFIR